MNNDIKTITINYFIFSLFIFAITTLLNFFGSFSIVIHDGKYSEVKVFYLHFFCVFQVRYLIFL